LFFTMDFRIAQSSNKSFSLLIFSRASLEIAI
jgi:hypothetical protein